MVSFVFYGSEVGYSMWMWIYDVGPDVSKVNHDLKKEARLLFLLLSIALLEPLFYLHDRGTPRKKVNK